MTTEEKKLEYNQNLLREFRTYKKNWNLHDAEPISIEIINRIEKLLPTLCLQPMLFAMADGSLSLIYTNDKGDRLLIRTFLETELYGVVYTSGRDFFLDAQKRVEEPELQEIVRAYKKEDSHPIKEAWVAYDKRKTIQKGMKLLRENSSV